MCQIHQQKFNFVKKFCSDRNCDFALSKVWEKGGEGGIDLANAILHTLETKESHFAPIYQDELPIAEKIQCVAKEIYGAAEVVFAPAAMKQIEKLEELGFGTLPVCMAKTQYSLSDDPSLLGRPKDFAMNIRGGFMFLREQVL